MVGSGRAGRRSRPSPRALAGLLTLGLLAGLGPAGPDDPSAAGGLPPASVGLVPVDDAAATERAEGRVIVRVEPGTDPQQVLDELGVDPAAVTHRLSHGVAVEADAELRARFAAHPAVAGVEDDQVVRALGEVPANVARIHAPAAHAAGFDGRPGARVAIVDTGIDLDHPDLVANLDADLGIDCTGTGSYDDDHYHGTHVAGTVAAAADGSGVLGVAPGARLVPVKVLDGGGGGTFAEVACGLDHVRALATDADAGNDVQVVNMSLGTYGSPGSSCSVDVLRQAVCDLVAAGVTVVAAAGNSSADAKSFVPASYPELVTVSALDDRTDSMASFTNHGATVELTAPGVSVTSSAKGGGERVASGTSMAAPAVAGAAAVVIASGVATSPAEVVATLRTHGECPDGTAAGVDQDCWGQGTWPGDRDPTAEPLVRVDDAIGLALPGLQIATPARHHVVGGLVPVTVRTGALPEGQSVRVRVGDEAWTAVSPDGAGDTSTWPWDTTVGADGPQTLTAEVVAAGGAPVAIATSQVVVRNSPLLFVEAPMAGTVRGELAFRVGVRHPTEPVQGLTVAAVVPTRSGTVALPLAYDAVADRFLGTWPTTSVLDGPAAVEIRATDSAGRTTTAARSLTVSNPPVVTIAAPASYADVGGPVPLRATAVSPLFEASQLTATWRAGASSGSLVLGADGAFTGTWTASDEPEGYVSITIEVRDPEGRVGTSTRTVWVRNEPSATLVSRAVTNPMTFAAKASSPLHPAADLIVRLDAHGLGAWDLAWDGTAHRAPVVDTTAWPEGTATADLTVTDPDGRTDTTVAALTISKAPTLTVVSPTTSNLNGTVPVAVVVSDPLGTPPAGLPVSLTVDPSRPDVPLVFDPTSGQHRASVDTTAWPDGSRYLTYRVTTPAGRSTVVERYAYVYNPLTVSVVAPAYGADVSGAVPLVARVTTTGGPVGSASVVASVDNGPSLPMTFDEATGTFGAVLQTEDWADGSRYVRVTATTPGKSAYSTVRLDFVNAPTLAFLAPGAHGTVSGPALVAVRAATPAGGPVDVQLQVGGSTGPVVPMVLDEVSGEHRATIQTHDSRDGYLDLRVTATDGRGRTQTAIRSVYVSNPLSVTPLRPAPSATVGGAVDVAVRLSYPANASVPTGTAVLQVDSGVGVPMVYDPASEEHRATLNSPSWFDGSHSLRVNATDAQGRSRTATWYVTAANRPVLSVQTPATGSPTVTGPVRVEATATDPQTAAGGLTLKATPSGAASVVLAYDAALGRYVGTWDSSTVPDGTTSVAVSATDADGLTTTTSRTVRPRNTPQAVIFPLAGAVDGVVTVQFTARRADGGPTGVRPAWRVDGGPLRSVFPAALEAGQHLARLDASALSDGSHTLTLEVTDEVTGRTGTAQQAFTVLRGAGLGAGLVGPVPGTTVTGLVPIEAVVYRPARVGSTTSTMAWYRVDDGPWSAMAAGSGGRFTATWDARAVTSGPHQVEIAATDWSGSTQVAEMVTVTGSSPLVVALAAPAAGATVDGRVRLDARATGGLLAWEPGRAVSAWYRVDDGPWAVFTGPAAGLTAVWDTATVRPGAHVLEVAAVDWGGGVAWSTTPVTVADRPALSLDVLSPAAGASGRGPIAVVARAVSATKAPEDLSVWARVGTGAYVALVLRDDGTFQGSLPIGAAASGTTLPVTVVATDYVNAVERTAGYRVVR